MDFLITKNYLRVNKLQRRKINKRDEKLLIVGGFVVEGSPETHPVVFLLVGGGHRPVNGLKLSNGSEWSRNRQTREVGLNSVLVRKENIDKDEIDLRYYRQRE